MTDLCTLYIEDNPSNLRLVERLVKRRPDVTLLTATRGADGLELARAETPDLVLLDLDLPDISGADVLTSLRADPRTASIPVVVVSADATPAQIERLRALGANDYVTKPFEVQRLLTVIDDAATAAASA
jgi:CheY-like chemotaxis protein